MYHFRPLRVLRHGVPSIVGIEGSHAGRRGYRVVVSMLGHREQVHPIVLFLVNV